MRLKVPTGFSAKVASAENVCAIALLTLPVAFVLLHTLLTNDHNILKSHAQVIPACVEKHMAHVWHQTSATYSD
jgi:hypothetical protein